MIEFTPDFFFDRDFVKSKMDAASVRNLSKFGSFVRTNARRGIRKRKKSATAGNRPHSHEGSLRNKIMFFYDPSTKSVVIGPTLLNGSRKQNKPATELLEHGGTVTLFWRKGKTLEYPKYPYMAPALQEESPRFLNLFANSVK